MVLPSPNFGDPDTPVLNINIKRSMNGTTRTYVKTSMDEVLQYDFILTRLKAVEVQAFLNLYYANNIRLIDYNGSTWVGKIVNDPIDMAIVRTGEECSFRLEFRGVQIG
jgi:hypothetical protein